MTEYRRNIAVGLTAAIALCGIAYMIMLFSNTPILARAGYTVKIRFPHAGSLERGSDVRLNGMRIGSVGEVLLLEDPRQGVIVDCHIDQGRKLPSDAAAVIAQLGLGAGSYVRLSAPPSAAPIRWLPEDGSAVIFGSMDAGGGMLGPEMIGQVEKVVDSFEAFRELAESLNVIAGDEENQQNIKASLANLRQATALATEAIAEFKQIARNARGTLDGVDAVIGEAEGTVRVARGHIDELGRKLIDDAEKLGTLFAALQQAAGTLNEREGTAGKLLNDPALYNNLRESAAMLVKTLAELQATVQVWQSEGVKLKL